MGLSILKVTNTMKSNPRTTMVRNTVMRSTPSKPDQNTVDELIKPNPTMVNLW